MDASTLAADLRADCETELHRLGSDKVLIARTGANLARDAVLRDAAGEFAHVRETLAAWADEDGPGAGTFAAAATRVGEGADAVTDALGEDVPPDAGALPAHLRDQDGTPERAGALLGYALVADRVGLQRVNFFINEADEGLADLFRARREDAEAVAGDCEALLDDVCDGEDEWASAEAAAVGAVHAAYDEYAETLGEMGLDPKPVC